ncbi:PHP domain-containing protein [Lapillicoccus jejuensis]|uniref:PHP domain-containing protein n=1 Tax=Lapillicoccus jejuensis TaxID=402171 RepID=A0A542E121_9MICO|nr:PHP domain-containing protein [Lapillicoccus jejuensis]TQJ08904.1 PHP domain-containing protein [Lapillicoccus jejuensis]
MTSHTHGGHTHSHDHDHPHSHADLPMSTVEAVDTQIPDHDLTAAGLRRRQFLTRAGLIGAAAAGASVLGQTESAAADGAAPTARPSTGSYQWLAGDHHIHTQYSSDAMYRVADQVQHAGAYGLDWMVITDHGSVTHAKLGVDQVNPDIVAARQQFGDRTLVFQGLEWNIPGAEHGTVFVHPGALEVAVLKEFENSFDGVVNGWTSSSAANEAHALDGLDFLAGSVTSGRVKDAAFFANHPARKGIDSPHEIRGWRDRQPTVALGMEGAPGHQAAGIPAPYGPGSGRGYYDNSPSADSFAGYPLESYVTYGGFDWMTATVGGLWDSLLAEGKAWWITANSDSHQIYLDDSVRGGAGTIDEFTALGHYVPPVHGTTGARTTQGDFWPGYYSKTHVGASRFSFAAVMDGLRAGRVWVDHGGLVGGLEVGVRAKGDRSPGATLGSVVTPKRGTRTELVVAVTPAVLPNFAQFLPQLARVDVVRGSVTGAASDRDTFHAPDTKVLVQRDVSGAKGKVVFTVDLGYVDEPFYVRLRGTDGKRQAVGLNGAAVDPAGPAADVLGDADPWQDLWFYTNPIWVLPR